MKIKVLQPITRRRKSNIMLLCVHGQPVREWILKAVLDCLLQTVFWKIPGTSVYNTLVCTLQTMLDFVSLQWL